MDCKQSFCWPGVVFVLMRDWRWARAALHRIFRVARAL
jgi:hypothetical protein